MTQVQTPEKAESPGAPHNWYNVDVSRVVEDFRTNAQNGISSSEAKKRLEQHGLNEIAAGEKISPWSILFAQFKNILIVILLVAVALSMILGHTIEAIAIFAILLFAVILGFLQEYRAERAIEALRKMAAPHAIVVREGHEMEVEAREIVPGDVVLIRAGGRIPADARLLEAFNLQVEESALTGESVPVEKNTATLEGDRLAAGDQKNMIFAGTIATYGRGRAVVVTTGMQTLFGQIAQMLQTVQTGKTPLQQNLDKVGHMLARAAVVVVLMIVALGLFRGQPLLEMIIFGIALAVAVVPEALPAVVTISLAMGVQRMVKRNALIRRLPAVETLGSTSIICSDKTGTLTKDEMTVRCVVIADQIFEVTGSGYSPEGDFRQSGSLVQPSKELTELLTAAVLASDAHVESTEDRWEVKGDPTEGALVVAAGKAGLNKTDLDQQFSRINEIPFTSERKRMTTLHRQDGTVVAYSKGAPEVVLASCSQKLTTSGPADLEEQSLLDRAKEMASQGLRVLAIACKRNADLKNAEDGMLFLGLIGIIDPARPEAKSAVQTAHDAGIKVVMITGDHPLTAESVAREVGILKEGRVLTGVQVDAMEDDQFQSEVHNMDVFARVSPAHKLRVITALQNSGHIVAMTGDGVNDAPALKKADIGIAMGITGTDVTKEAASMTLTDDNFASIVAAVEEGRAIFGNIKKYLMYLLSSNIGEIVLMAGASVVGLPLPLSAVQILYVNLATDGLPALALSVDPPESDLMKQKPRNPHTGIFTRPVIVLMVAGGMWSALVNLSLFTWALQSGRRLSEAMTLTFVSLVLIQFFKAYNFRSDHDSVLHKPFANRWLNLAIIWELVLLGLILYVPVLSKPFGTFNLSVNDWMIVIGLSLTISPVLELVKWALRRGWFAEPMHTQ
jgi:Ca2+-transporting ATPase